MLAPSAPRPGRPTIPATRVLVVEDEAMIAWMVESLLEEMGFTQIVLAANGAQARAAAARAHPGLIVSDVNLGPGPDGIGTAAAICGETPVPVIFVTAYADEDTRCRIAREVPGAPVLRKPFAGEALRRTILGALGCDCGG